MLENKKCRHPELSFVKAKTQFQVPETPLITFFILIWYPMGPGGGVSEKRTSK